MASSEMNSESSHDETEEMFEEKPFICVECGDCFSFKDSLAAHMLTHDNEHCGEQKPVICQVCGDCFTEVADLETHTNENHKDKNGFVVKLFEYNTYYECGRIIVKNNENAVDKDENSTDKCIENKDWNKVEIKEVKSQSMDEESDDKKLPVLIISKESPYVKNMSTTKHAVVGDQLFKCDDCGKTYKSNKSLKDHLRTHKTDRPFICEECGKDFTSNYNLKSHLKTHNPSKNFSCEVCGKSFAYSNSLVNHQRKHTGERPYVCPFCDRRFICSSNLVSHIRTHTGNKPFKCDECGRGFNYKGELERHKRIHTGEKPYKCELCDKCYNCVGELTRHRRTHTGERPYKCEECGKKFLRNSHLTSHMKTHTGEKPFQCEVCFKSFMFSVDLVRHTRTHTGEKPFQCHQCGKCFNRDTHLKKHLKLHDSDKIKIKLFDDINSEENKVTRSPSSGKKSKKGPVLNSIEKLKNGDKLLNSVDKTGDLNCLPNVYEFGEKNVVEPMDQDGQLTENMVDNDQDSLPKIYPLNTNRIGPSETITNSAHNGNGVVSNENSTTNEIAKHSMDLSVEGTSISKVDLKERCLAGITKNSKCSTETVSDSGPMTAAWDIDHSAALKTFFNEVNYSE